MLQSLHELSNRIGEKMVDRVEEEPVAFGRALSLWTAHIILSSLKKRIDTAEDSTGFGLKRPQVYR